MSVVAGAILSGGSLVASGLSVESESPVYLGRDLQRIPAWPAWVHLVVHTEL